MTRVLFFVVLLVLAGLAFAIDDGITERVTVPAGSYIIDVDGSGSGGSVAEPAGLTIANGIKPYGLIYALVVNHKVPVQWVIEPGKARDGVDITIAGKNYRGGPFVIPAIFATPTKPDAKGRWGISGLAEVRRKSRHRLVAIGGLDASNVADVVRAGADCIAVVSAICSAPDPYQAARTLNQIFQETLREQSKETP